MPTETELKVLDTYWSDHCRHTTFETELKHIDFSASKFQKQLQATYDKYIAMRDELGRSEKPQTLMDMATIFGRYERANGRLDDMEVSDEINACSVEIEVDVNGVKLVFVYEYCLSIKRCVFQVLVISQHQLQKLVLVNCHNK